MEDPNTMADTPKWEIVTEKIPGQDFTEKLKVETGYLYRTTVIAGATTDAAGQVAVAQTFVPDSIVKR
jgi:hypothetical protein